MTFRYFAYGSNLLTSRMHINCPSAKFKSIGRLENFELTFQDYSKSWMGCSATIVESPGKYVFGVVYDISKDHEEALTKQEKKYEEIMVTVQSNDDQKLLCKTYLKLNSEVGLPSAIYKEVILKGALEHNLPDYYITFLKSFKDNGYKGKVEIPVKL